MPLALPTMQPHVLGVGRGLFTLPEDFSRLQDEAIRSMFETGV